MTRKSLFNSFVFVAALSASQMALAEPVAQPTTRSAGMACAPHAAMVAKLSGSYSEKLVSLGLTANGQVMQIFSTEAGETWTLLSTNPQGITCILASGKHWQGALTTIDGPAA